MSTAKPYRIVIADDHSVVRRGIRELLRLQPGLEVCSEASTGSEAIERVKKDRPNLVILDLAMPEANGLGAARTIRHESPETEVMVLSMHFSNDLAREVLRAGALAYVLKSDAEDDLLAAVDHVRRGQPFFAGELAVSMKQMFIQHQDGKETGLTCREVEVVRLLATGKCNKEVAWALKVSTRTVECHRQHIMHKMGFRAFSDLVRFALSQDLVEPWPSSQEAHREPETRKDPTTSLSGVAKSDAVRGGRIAPLTNLRDRRVTLCPSKSPGGAILADFGASGKLKVRPR